MEATELTDEQIKDTAAIVIALTQLEETLGSEGRPLLASHAAAARYSLRWMATRLMPPPAPPAAPAPPTAPEPAP